MDLVMEMVAEEMEETGMVEDLEVEMIEVMGVGVEMIAEETEEMEMYEVNSLEVQSILVGMVTEETEEI